MHRLSGCGIDTKPENRLAPNIRPSWPGPTPAHPRRRPADPAADRGPRRLRWRRLSIKGNRTLESSGCPRWVSECAWRPRVRRGRGQRPRHCPLTRPGVGKVGTPPTRPCVPMPRGHRAPRASIVERMHAPTARTLVCGRSWTPAAPARGHLTTDTTHRRTVPRSGARGSWTATGKAPPVRRRRLNRDAALAGSGLLVAVDRQRHRDCQQHRHPRQ
jgi:hypothetical protein